MFSSTITLLLLYLLYATHPNIVDSYFYILSCEFDEYLNELQWMHLLLTPLVYKNHNVAVYFRNMHITRSGYTL